MAMAVSGWVAMYCMCKQLLHC